MEVFLVGGAVRDSLLGRPVTERDYVVTGASAQQLIDAGYTPVGRDSRPTSRWRKTSAAATSPSMRSRSRRTER